MEKVKCVSDDGVEVVVVMVALVVVGGGRDGIQLISRDGLLWYVPFLEQIAFLLPSVEFSAVYYHWLRGLDDLPLALF